MADKFETQFQTLLKRIAEEFKKCSSLEDLETLKENLEKEIESAKESSGLTDEEKQKLENAASKEDLEETKSELESSLEDKASTNDLATKINMTGARGSIAGYETVGTSATISQDSPDSNECGSNVTVSNGTSGTCWTKIVRVTSAISITLGSSWKWQGGSAPDIASGGILVLCWCGSGGLAQFNSPE